MSKDVGEKMRTCERLKAERLRLSLSQEELARLGDVSRRAQASYESGERSPRAEYLEAVALGGVDVAYVLTGRRVGEPIQVASDSPGDSYSAVPMYDIEAAAGPGRFFDAENIESTVYFETAQLLAEGLNPEQVVGAKVRGDSMGDTLRDGDKVLVDRSQRTPDGVFLLRMGEELRIKRVQRVAGGALMLISDNARYQPELVKPQDQRDVEIIGRCEVRIGRVS